MIYNTKKTSRIFIHVDSFIMPRKYSIKIGINNIMQYILQLPE